MELWTEVVDSPRSLVEARHCGAIDIMIAPGATFLPEPTREALPDAPPMGSDAAAWNDYFTRLTQRTRELVAKHDAETQAALDAETDSWAKAAESVFGKEIGGYVRSFYRWSSRVGATIGKFFSGGDPGWNDQRWIDASLARVAHLGEQGYAAFPPYEGPDRASTEDAIDWEGNLAEAERRMNALWSRHPDEAAAVDAAIRWGKTHPDDPLVTAVRDAGAWPIPLQMGRPGISDAGLVAIARLLAASHGRDPDWLTAAAFVHEGNALAEDLRLRKTGEAANLDADGFYGTDYLFGDLLAAVVRSIPDAPPTSAPVVRTDLLWGSSPGTPSLGAPSGSSAPGTASGGDGGGGGIIAAAIAAALLFA